MLGILTTETAFDDMLIVYINSAIMQLRQLNIGPENGFAITGSTETWNDLLGSSNKLESVKMYVYLKVKLGFDTPSSSFVVDALNAQLKECEWRLNVAAEE